MRLKSNCSHFFLLLNKRCANLFKRKVGQREWKHCKGERTAFRLILQWKTQQTQINADIATASKTFLGAGRFAKNVLLECTWTSVNNTTDIQLLITSDFNGQGADRGGPECAVEVNNTTNTDLRWYWTSVNGLGAGCWSENAVFNCTLACSNN